MKKIAILGATGYIGKSLTNLSSQKEFEVFLFARSMKKLKNFLCSVEQENRFKANYFNKFRHYKYDAIINCVGIGNPNDIKKSGFKIFETTEKFDDLILNYLKNSPKTKYINLSSGAIYGKNKGPIENKTISNLNMNCLDKSDYYSIAKINSEAKHRSLIDLNIVDLRIFSFFSRFIKLDSGYLMSDIINSIKNKKTLITTPENIIRDYAHPKDLLKLIKLIIKRNKINDFFDVYSLKPISKFELLKYFANKYGLKYKIKKDFGLCSPTGSKNLYYSKNRKAKILGYIPEFTSLKGIEKEIKKIL